MPPLAMASAVSLMSCALTSHPKWFQLFQPIGGVRARRLSSERAGSRTTARPRARHMSVANRRETRQPLSGGGVLFVPPLPNREGGRGGGRAPPAGEPEDRGGPHQ